MKKLIVATALCAAGVGAMAQSVIAGQTFSVTSDYDYDPSNPRTVTFQSGATVGNYGAGEQTVARSEFNLAGLNAVSHAVVSFVLTSATVSSGFPGASIFPFVTFAYRGDNQRTVTDYAPAFQTSLGQSDALQVPSGTAFTYDVTGLLNAAIARGDAAFGLGLGGAMVGHFATFDTFTLAFAAPVPEPEVYALMLGGLAMLAMARRRRSAASVDAPAGA